MQDYKEHTPRRWIDNDTLLGPLKIEGFEPSELSIRILSIIAETLQTNPFLVGGALTAQYNGYTPVDYDVHLDIEDTAATQQVLSDNMQDLVEAVKEQLRATPELEESQELQETDEGYFDTVGSIRMTFEKAILDIKFMDKTLDLKTAAMYGDAVITSCAMDHEGNALFHPRYEPDMDNKVWSIRVLGDQDKRSSRNRAIKKIEREGSYLDGFQIIYPDQYAATL